MEYITYQMLELGNTEDYSMRSLDDWHMLPQGVLKFHLVDSFQNSYHQS